MNSINLINVKITLNWRKNLSIKNILLFLNSMYQTKVKDF